MVKESWIGFFGTSSAEALQEFLIQKAQGVLYHPGICHAHGGRLA